MCGLPRGSLSVFHDDADICHDHVLTYDWPCFLASQVAAVHYLVRIREAHKLSHHRLVSP